MAVTPAAIKDCFPEFSGLTPARIQIALDMALCNINPTQWAGKADLGTKWLAAHYLKVLESGGGAAAGPMTSRRTGDVAEAFAAPTELTKQSSYGATSYGREFLQLQLTIFSERCL